MHVIDAHRLLGPVPTGPGPGNVPALLERMDQLDISHAVVTPSWHIFGDPRASEEYDAHLREALEQPRLTIVPCVIPSSLPAAGTGLPDDAPIVRTCPVRHRFDLLGPPGRRAWGELRERRGVLVLDAMEVGPTGIDAVCLAEPGLKVFMVNPRYREVRRISELLTAHENLVVEAGTLNSAGSIEFLATHLGAHRLVFGTSAPLHDDGGPRFALDRLFLDETDVEMIARGSWERFTKEAE